MLSIYKDTEIRKLIINHTFRNYSLHYISLIISGILFKQFTYQFNLNQLLLMLVLSLLIAIYEVFCFQDKMQNKTSYLFRHFLFILPVLCFECCLFYYLNWYDAPLILAAMILLIDIIIILIENYQIRLEKRAYADALKHYQINNKQC